MTDLPKRLSQSRRLSVESRRVSIDSRRFSDSIRIASPSRRHSPTFNFQPTSPHSPHMAESPAMRNQFSVSLSSPVDLDIEAALDPKPIEFEHELKDASRTEVNESKRPSISDERGAEERQKELSFYVGQLDPEEHPQNFSLWRKFIILFVMATGALCSTCASSMAAFAEGGIIRDLHVSKEVAILGISLYVAGIAIGPLLVGPLSEVYGRNIVYRLSYLLFFACSWPVAFAPHIAVFLIFRFATGFFSSAFLSVAGGSVSDIFLPQNTPIPMALYTLAPFIGPMLGPLLSGIINQNANWRWTFRVLIIWVFVETVMIYVAVPETYEPVLLKRKAEKLRETTGDDRYYAALDKREQSLAKAIMVSCYRPFELLFFDRMILLLNLWTSLLFGILYLAFQAFPYIYAKHGFDLEQTGLAFIGIGIGMMSGCAMNIALIIYGQKHAAGGVQTPESRLLPGKVGAIIVPISLYWLAFTTYKQVHWIVPTIASAFFGAGFLLCFSGTFTYLVIAYRPMAASAMAANAFTRSSFAAAFPLFAGQMYTALGTVGATALLAGVVTVTAPLPFIFSMIGARLRAQSPFALH